MIERTPQITHREHLGLDENTVLPAKLRRCALSKMDETLAPVTILSVSFPGLYIDSDPDNDRVETV